MSVLDNHAVVLSGGLTVERPASSHIAVPVPPADELGKLRRFEIPLGFVA